MQFIVSQKDQDTSNVSFHNQVTFHLRAANARKRTRGNKQQYL